MTLRTGTSRSGKIHRPVRLTEMLVSLADQRATKSAALDTRRAILQREATEAEERLRRLYKLVEDGMAEMDDILKDRIARLSSDRDRARTAAESVQPQRAIEISPSAMERFGVAMRQNLTTGEVSFRKAYIGSIVDRIEVDDAEIRIIGRKDLLEQAILASGRPNTGVRSFVRKWRAGQDETANTYVIEVPI
jgi:site-specific DNA recombinase